MSEKRLFKTLKRGMAVALVMSLVTGMVPLNVSNENGSVKEAKAAENSWTDPESNFSWSYNISNIEGKDYATNVYITSEPSGMVTIPDTVNGLPVYSIGDGTNNVVPNEVSTVKISGQIKEINDNAFKDCTAITKVNFRGESTCTRIGDNAFGGCTNLIEFTVPKSVDSLGASCFAGCNSLNSLKFENGSQCTCLGDNAFQQCTNLMKFELPANVTDMGIGSFSGCSGLESFIFKSGSCIRELKTDVFKDCANLTAIDIPIGVTVLPTSCFEGCTNLVDVKISKNITKIEDRAFYNCASLENFRIPRRTEKIGKLCFYNTKLQNIYIPEGVTSLGDYAFLNCKFLNQIQSDADVDYKFAFTNCSKLENITFGNNVKTVDGTAFSSQGTENSPTVERNFYFLNPKTKLKKSNVDNVFPEYENFSKRYTTRNDNATNMRFSVFNRSSSSVESDFYCTANGGYFSFTLSNPTYKRTEILGNVVVEQDVYLNGKSDYIVIFDMYITDMGSMYCYSKSSSTAIPLVGTLNHSIIESLFNKQYDLEVGNRRAYISTGTPHFSSCSSNELVTMKDAIVEKNTKGCKVYTYLDETDNEGDNSTYVYPEFVSTNPLSKDIVSNSNTTVCSVNGIDENTVIPTCKPNPSLNYDVTTNGGTSVAPDSIDDIEPDTVFDSASGVFNHTASKPGWEFVGWNTDKDAHTAINTVTMDSDKTLYAIFKKDIDTSFTDVNGTEKRVRNDSASMWNSATSAAVTLPEQGTKTGWTSMGWSLSENPDLSDIISDATYDISESTDFYGVYKKRKVINIDTDGDGTPDDTVETDIISNGSEPDKTEGKVTAPDTPPSSSKEGYEADGWCEKDGDGTVYQPGEEMTVTGKGDIVPHFKPVTYKVHFDINNGTSGIMTDQTLTYDATSNLASNTFTRTGYTFAGWSDTPDGDIKYTDGQSVKNLTSVKNATVNMYAVWKANVSGLKIVPNGGEWSHGGNSYKEPESYTQDYNTTLNIADPERTGYTFREWIKSFDENKASGFNGSLNNKVYTFGEKNNAEDILTADWTANTYKVEYYNGSTKSGESNHTYDDTDALTTAHTLGMAKRGYTFAGWSDTADGDVKYTDGQSIKNLTAVNNSTVKLYAVWKENESGLTVVPNGGEWRNNGFKYTSPKVFKQKYNSTLNIADPERTGYTFKGWEQSFDNSKASSFNGSLNNKVYTFGENDNAADTITALWEVNKYTVEYYDGNTKKGNSTLTYDASKALTKASELNISKTGYEFKGWSDTLNGSVKYTDGQNVKNLSSTNGAVVKLYAVYELKKYSITYNGMTGASHGNKTFYTVNDSTFRLSEPVKSGALFLGWTGEGNTVPTKDITVNPSQQKNLEYTANWQILISVNIPAKVDVSMTGGTTEDVIPVTFSNTSQSDLKIRINSFKQTKSGDFELVDKSTDEKTDWSQKTHTDRTMALYVENGKDSGFKSSGVKAYVNDADRELGIISPGRMATPYVKCHHTSSITDKEMMLSMGSYTVEWNISVN